MPAARRAALLSAAARHGGSPVQELHTPAGTPPEVIQAIACAAQAASEDQEVRDSAARASGEVSCLDTAGFAAFLATDRRHWEQTVAALKAQ